MLSVSRCQHPLAGNDGSAAVATAPVDGGGRRGREHGRDGRDGRGVRGGRGGRGRRVVGRVAPPNAISAGNDGSVAVAAAPVDGGGGHGRGRR